MGYISSCMFSFKTKQCSFVLKKGLNDIIYCIGILYLYQKSFTMVYLVQTIMHVRTRSMAQSNSTFRKIENIIIMHNYSKILHNLCYILSSSQLQLPNRDIYIKFHVEKMYFLTQSKKKKPLETHDYASIKPISPWGV